MTHLSTLWLPILLSSIAMFLVSSFIHMASPWHKDDYPKLANEDQIMDALRPLAIPPGDYMVPRPTSMEDMKSSDFQAKLERGPKFMMTVMPNGMGSMSRNFVQWFAFLIVCSVLAAYVAAHALPLGAPFRSVFRFVGLTVFIANSLALWPMSIWYSRGWKLTARATVDALIYGALAAAIFGALWPH